MATSYLEGLKERRLRLVNQLAAEDQANDRSQIYIDDLQSSIDNIDSQIKNYKETDGKYQIINGKQQ